MAAAQWRCAKSADGVNRFGRLKRMGERPHHWKLRHFPRAKENPAAKVFALARLGFTRGIRERQSGQRRDERLREQAIGIEMRKRRIVARRRRKASATGGGDFGRIMKAHGKLDSRF